MRKKRAPCGGRVRHSSEEYDNEAEGTRDPRWGVKPVLDGGRRNRRGRRSRRRRRGLVPSGGRGRLAGVQ